MVRRTLKRGDASQTSTEDQPEISDIAGEQTEIDKLKAKIATLEPEVGLQRESADFFERERDHLKDLFRKQPKKYSRKHFSLASIKDSDELVCLYTGFPTHNAMMACLNNLSMDKI